MLLVRARRQFRHRKLEWFTSYLLLSWGVALGLGVEAFDLPAYAMLERWAPQGYWAILCVLLGGARMVTLVINGLWPRGYWLRVVGAGIGFNYWAAVATGFASTGGWTAVAAYHAVALAELINAYMIMRDHRETSLEPAS